MQRQLRRMENDWWTNKAKEIQAFADRNDSHNFYDAIKAFYGPSNRNSAPVRTADGTTLLKDKSQILARWAEHFGELLNRRNETDPGVLEELPTFPKIP